MYVSATLPYTPEILAHFIARYNAENWPVAIIAALLTVAALWLCLRADRSATRFIGILLALFWGWTGCAFYLTGFAAYDFLAPIYGWAFIAEAALLAVGFTLRAPFVVSLRLTPAAVFGLALLFAALMAYPAAMVAYEGSWASYRFVGLTPVATSLFTLGVLALGEGGGKVRASLAVLPALHLIAAAASAVVTLHAPG